MEDKTYEAKQQWSKLHTSKKLVYIFIVVSVSSLPLPFWFHSFGFKLTNVVDASDRHCIFLLCNAILVFLSFYSRTKESSQTQSQLDHMSSIVNGDDLPKQVAIEERPKAKQIECNEISVVEVDDGDDQVEHHIETEHVGCATTEVKVEVKEEEEGHIGTLLGDRTTEVKVEVKEEEEEEGHIGTLLADVEDREDQTDNMEIESFVHADYDHEEMRLTSEAEIEEEGHEEEDVNELNQKCDEFIHRMKLTMRLEANSTLVLNSHQCHLCMF